MRTNTWCLPSPSTVRGVQFQSMAVAVRLGGLLRRTHRPHGGASYVQRKQKKQETDLREKVLAACPAATTPHGKCQLLHPATPYYPFPRGKFHTRGNIWSFTVGWHECCDPAGVAGSLCPVARPLCDTALAARGGHAHAHRAIDRFQSPCPPWRWLCDSTLLLTCWPSTLLRALHPRNHGSAGARGQLHDARRVRK